MKLPCSHRAFVTFGMINVFLLGAGVARAAGTPLLEYTFNDTGTTAASTGSDTTSLTLYNSSGTATDLHGAAGSGVSGAASDFAFDNTAATGMGTGFNGGSAASVGDLQGVDTLKSFTLAGWFKTDGTTVIGNNARLLDNQNGAAGTGFILFASGSSGTLTLQINNNQYVSTSGAYNATQSWVFFAVTDDGQGNVSFYIGDTATSVSLVNSVSGTAILESDNATSLSIGNATAGNRPFDGLMDDIRVYGSSTVNDSNAVLTQSDLESLRSADISAIPEPATYTLLGGLVALSIVGLRRRRRS